MMKTPISNLLHKLSCNADLKICSPTFSVRLAFGIRKSYTDGQPVPQFIVFQTKNGQITDKTHNKSFQPLSTIAALTGNALIRYKPKLNSPPASRPSFGCVQTMKEVRIPLPDIPYGAGGRVKIQNLGARVGVHSDSQQKHERRWDKQHKWRR